MLGTYGTLSGNGGGVVAIDVVTRPVEAAWEKGRHECIYKGRDVIGLIKVENKSILWRSG